ncbi:MAG: hypothetical protein KJO03_00355 [Gammaproteobacteria bacterium]|nr:hypothetical protein [Gammaproteobacteria bacterium]NNJ49954.1 hypothetical protein [Gammaproteobacteria bacterium]
MKPTIHVGAYGWLHQHWMNSFYPEDLPADWRLGYYSNEFNTVLVPSFYWQQRYMVDCETLLDDVHSSFQFYIECDNRIFDMVSLSELSDALNLLKPQLSGLVFPGGGQVEKVMDERFIELADSLQVDMIEGQSESGSDKLWCSAGSSKDARQQVRFALLEDDLRDLRAVRPRIEPFISQLQDLSEEDASVVMIVSHPQLQAADLGKFRSMLEIMGH